MRNPEPGIRSTPMNALLQPDVLLPAQMVASSVGDPERRLRLAVLENAIGYVRTYLHAEDGHGRALYEDALDWFSDPDRSEPFSFENVCDALQLDPDYIRRGLRRWHDAGRDSARTSEWPRSVGDGARRLPRTGRARQRAA